MRNKSLYLGSDSLYCFIYCGVMLWILPGLLRVADRTGVMAYSIYVAAFCVTAYLLCNKASAIQFQFRFNKSLNRTVEVAIIFTALTFPFLHWIQLGGLPLLHAFNTTDYIETTLIRQRIFEHAGIIWRYGASLEVISVLPFLVFLCFVKQSRWFWTLAFFALLYAASLLQKSYVIVVFLPTIVFALQKKQFRAVSLLTLLSGISVFVLVLATNPNLRPDIKLIQEAKATTEDNGANVERGNWISYGGSMEQALPGRFSSGAFYFNGNRSILHDRTATQWSVGRDDFSLEFWTLPLEKPSAGNISTLYWNGPAKIDYQGSSYIAYGANGQGVPYVKFESTDRSRVFSISLIMIDALLQNKWNHVYVARAGNTFFLGVNGKVVQGSGTFVDLTIDGENPAIVQFGAQFADEIRATEKRFFKGYIDEVTFTKRSVKYKQDYVVPDRPSSKRTVGVADITEVQESSRSHELPPSWLPNFLPAWLNALIHRIFFVPGEVVGSWFIVIPVDLPFAHGCGYRTVAALLGCEHQNFPELVYAIYNKSLVEQGVLGTMNAASFMEDYANFGLPGLVGSGIVLAVLLYFLGILFAGRRQIGVALNIVPLLYLSSTALLSLLFSGGWIVTILLYSIFYKEFDKSLKDGTCAV